MEYSEIRLVYDLWVYDLHVYDADLPDVMMYCDPLY